MTGRMGLDHVAFAVPDRSAVDDAARILKDTGARVLGGGTEWDEPGSPYGVRFCDPEGNRLEVCAGMDEFVGPEIPHAAKPTKLGHVPLHAKDPAESVKFYTDVLDFRISDKIAGDVFFRLRCNPDHHATALVKGPAPSMNHAGYEVADIAWKNGVRLLWGIGRHGPGHNLSMYYPDPDGNVVEIFAEPDQIHDDENYRPHTWNPNSSFCVWTHVIPQNQVQTAQAVGRAVNQMGEAEGRGCGRFRSRRRTSAFRPRSRSPRTTGRHRSGRSREGSAESPDPGRPCPICRTCNGPRGGRRRAG